MQSKSSLTRSSESALQPDRSRKTALLTVVESRRAMDALAERTPPAPSPRLRNTFFKRASGLSIAWSAVQQEASLVAGDAKQNKSYFAVTEDGLKLLQRIREKKIDEIMELLESGISASSVDENGTSALHLASKDGSTELITTLLNRRASVNCQDKNGDTPLHLACSTKHSPAVRTLLQLGADVNMTNKKRMTVLHVAVVCGDEALVREILSFGANVNAFDQSGLSPLHHAALKGLTAIADIIVNCKDCQVDCQNENGCTPLHLASEKRHGKICRILLHKGANFSTLDNRGLAPLTWAFENGANYKFFSEVSSFGKDLSNPYLVEALCGNFSVNSDIVISTLQNSSQEVTNNYSELVRSLIASLRIEKNPVYYFNSRKQALFRLLRAVFDRCHSTVFLGFVLLRRALKAAAENRPTESREFTQHQKQVERMIISMFSADGMDEAGNFMAVIFANDKFIDMFSSNGERKAASKPRSSAIMENDENSLVAVLTGEECKKLRERYIYSAKALLQTNVLGMCLEDELKNVFAVSQVSSLVDGLFWDHLSLETRRLPMLGKQLRAKSRSSTLLSFFRNARSCGAFIFFCRGLGKLAMLSMISAVSLEINKDKPITIPESRLAIVLLFLLFSSVIFELGQILDSSEYGFTSITDGNTLQNTKPPIRNGTMSRMTRCVSSRLLSHFRDPWNVLDFCSYSFLGVWGILLAFPEYSILGRLFLSISAIPLSLGLLQYLAITRPFGLLVLMIFEMLKDVSLFLIVFLVCIFGFGVAFSGLFHETHAFRNNAQTVLALFSASLNNYDFSDFTTHPLYTSVGTILMVAFITLTSILLWNLLIARLSSTHQKIDEQSFEEWSFFKARTVQHYHLLFERNPFCMLPPPLNIVTTAVMVPGLLFGRKWSFTVSGAVANYLFRMLTLLPRLLVMVWVEYSRVMTWRDFWNFLSILPQGIAAEIVTAVVLDTYWFPLLMNREYGKLQFSYIVESAISATKTDSPRRNLLEKAKRHTSAVKVIDDDDSVHSDDVDANPVDGIDRKNDDDSASEMMVDAEMFTDEDFDIMFSEVLGNDGKRQNLAHSQISELKEQLDDTKKLLAEDITRTAGEINSRLNRLEDAMEELLRRIPKPPETSSPRGKA